MKLAGRSRLINDSVLCGRVIPNVAGLYGLRTPWFYERHDVILRDPTLVPGSHPTETGFADRLSFRHPQPRHGNLAPVRLDETLPAGRLGP